MGGGGGTPKPSSEERQLQAAQTQSLGFQNQMLRQQYADQQLLAPLLYKQAGLTPIYENAAAVPGSAVKEYIASTANTDFKNMASEYMSRHAGGAPTMEGLKNFIGTVNFNQKDQMLADVGGFQSTSGPQGKIVGFEDAPKTEAQKLRESIELRMLQRSDQALRGELPDDPNLIRGLAREEKTLRDTMSARFGPDWETGSPGIEALGDFMANKEGILYNARRDQLTTSEALGLAREGANQQRFYQGIGTATGNQSNIASLFGQQSQGYTNAIQGMRQERMAEGQNKAQGKAAMFGAGGAVVGTAAGVAIAM